MKPGQTVRFQSLPVGAVFSSPDPSWSPLRVKLNDNSAGDYPPGPMGPGQPSYHFTGLEWCLVRVRERERRTGAEDRRSVNDVNAHMDRGPNACRANAGRREGDSERFKERLARTARQDSKPGLEMTLTVDVGPELRLIGKIDKILGNHFGVFRRAGLEAIPDLVEQVCQDSRARAEECRRMSHELRAKEMHVETLQKRLRQKDLEITVGSNGIAEPTTFGERYFAKLADDRGHELQAQQRRMAAVREALNLPIGEPVEAIKGLQAALEASQRVFERQRDLSAETTRERDALAEELRQTKARMERERLRYLRERGEMKALLMGRPTGLGPRAFAEALGTCPWKFRQEFDDKRATGRTTRMLTAALDAMIDGEKVLVCAAGAQERSRLMQQAEEMLRKRVQSYVTNTTLRELSCPPFPGRVRFAVLPPPVQAARIERDLERGDIFVDHYAVERLFDALTHEDGRSRGMLRLAYPNLAKQLDR